MSRLKNTIKGLTSSIFNKQTRAEHATSVFEKLLKEPNPEETLQDFVVAKPKEASKLITKLSNSKDPDHKDTFCRTMKTPGFLITLAREANNGIDKKMLTKLPPEDQKTVICNNDDFIGAMLLYRGNHEEIMKMIRLMNHEDIKDLRTYAPLTIDQLVNSSFEDELTQLLGGETGHPSLTKGGSQRLE